MRKAKRTLAVLLTVLLITSQLSSLASDEPSVWAKEVVEQAIAAGLTTPTVTTGYQTNITRENFCELIIKLYERLTGKTATVGTNPFTDTTNEDILKAYKLGIVSGVGGNRFAPDNTITRQEICVMLKNAIVAIVPGIDAQSSSGVMFYDREMIASWAIGSVEYIYELSVTRGIDTIDDLPVFGPLGFATHEQAILFVHKIFLLFNDITDKTYTITHGSHFDMEKQLNELENNLALQYAENDTDIAQIVSIVNYAREILFSYTRTAPDYIVLSSGTEISASQNGSDMVLTISVHTETP